MKPRLFRTAADWRAWLEKNGEKEKKIVLAYYKKGTGKKSVTYQEALDEGLCFGWIDSTVNRLDDERYMQVWTKRNPKSIWSAANKARVKRLLAEGRMAEPGLASIRIAKRNGQWTKIEKIERNPEPPAELAALLQKDPAAQAYWQALPESQRKMYAYFVGEAKQAATRERRAKASFAWIRVGRRIGMQAPKTTAAE